MAEAEFSVHILSLKNYIFILNIQTPLGSDRGGSGFQPHPPIPFDSKFHFHWNFCINLIKFGYRIYPKYAYSLPCNSF